MGEWMPIESAPMTTDGDILLLLEGGHPEDYQTRVRMGHWTHGMYGDSAEPFWADWNTPSDETEWDRLEPTHWMPLPDPPAQRIEPNG